MLRLSEAQGDTECSNRLEFGLAADVHGFRCEHNKVGDWSSRTIEKSKLESKPLDLCEWPNQEATSDSACFALPWRVL